MSWLIGVALMLLMEEFIRQFAKEIWDGMSGEDGKPKDRPAQVQNVICPHCNTVLNVPDVEGVYRCEGCKGYLTYNRRFP